MSIYLDPDYHTAVALVVFISATSTRKVARADRTCIGIHVTPPPIEHHPPQAGAESHTGSRSTPKVTVLKPIRRNAADENRIPTKMKAPQNVLSGCWKQTGSPAVQP